jgi:carboxyl-terminal processing protease
MQSENYDLAAGRRPRRRLRTWLKRGATLGVVALAFFAGQAVGDGRIAIHRGVSKDLPARLDYTSVNQVYQSLKDNYDGKLTETQLINGLKHGLAEATNDPYTVYFTPKEAEAFNNQLNNSFSGIGAQLGQDKDKNLQVIAPIDGYPAAKAGIKAGDLIIKINGASTGDMSVDEAVSRIRGRSGTPVTLQILRNKQTTLTFKIKRADIKLPSVKTKILKGDIGYIQLADFADDTARLAQQAADKFKREKVKGIILDLRNNGGGYLDAAVRVSSLWLKPGETVVDQKRGSEVTESATALGGAELHGIPTVVLINGGSASASEITTGALHDNGDAYVIGEKSYGKGVVQQLVNFGDGSQLKVTIASWYRPNGQNINHKGITPDKVVRLPEGGNIQAGSAGDTQLKAAQTYLNK